MNSANSALCLAVHVATIRLGRAPGEPDSRPSIAYCTVCFIRLNAFLTTLERGCRLQRVLRLCAATGWCQMAREVSKALSSNERTRANTLFVWQETKARNALCHQYYVFLVVNYDIVLCIPKCVSLKGLRWKQLHSSYSSLGPTQDFLNKVHLKMKTKYNVNIYQESVSEIYHLSDISGCITVNACGCRRRLVVHRQLGTDSTDPHLAPRTFCSPSNAPILYYLSLCKFCLNFLQAL